MPARPRPITLSTSSCGQWAYYRPRHLDAGGDARSACVGADRCGRRNVAGAARAAEAPGGRLGAQGRALGIRGAGVVRHHRPVGRHRRPGKPPNVDVFIDTKRPIPRATTRVAVTRRPRWIGTPALGRRAPTPFRWWTNNQVLVKVRNRGQSLANGVTVQVWCVEWAAEHGPAESGSVHVDEPRHERGTSGAGVTDASSGTVRTIHGAAYPADKAPPDPRRCDLPCRSRKQ